MTNRSAGARGLVFGGIMAALVVLFSLVPILTMFMVVPLVLTHLRFGGRTAVLTATVATLFTLMFLGPVPVLTYVIPTGILPGLVFGYGFKHKLKPLMIGLVAIAVSFLGFAMTYSVARVVTFAGEDPIAKGLESVQVQDLMQKSFHSLELVIDTMPEGTARELEAKRATRAMLDEFKRDPVGMTWTLLPVTLLLSGAFSTWINFLICRWVIPRFGHEVPKPAPFGDLYVPAWLSVVFVLASFGNQYLTGSLVGLPWWAKLMVNAMLPLFYLYLLVGVAVVYGFLRRKELPKWAAAGYSLLGFLLGPLGTQLYVMVAVADSMIDIRGLGHGLMRLPKETP